MTSIAQVAPEIAQLRCLLEEERAAIMRLDVAAIDAFEQKKAALLLPLRSLLGEARSVAARAANAEALKQLRWQAEVNRILLAEALQAISTLLGANMTTNSYDHLGALRRQSTSRVDVGA